MEDNLKYLILLFPVVGVCLLLVGIAYKRRLTQKIIDFSRIQGVVIGFRSGLSSPTAAPGTVYHPIVEYRVEDAIYSVQSAVGYGKPKETEGSKVDILYDRSNPSDAYIVKDYYFGPHMMIAIGSMFFLMGAFMVYQLL